MCYCNILSAYYPCLCASCRSGCTTIGSPPQNQPAGFHVAPPSSPPHSRLNTTFVSLIRHNWSIKLNFQQDFFIQHCECLQKWSSHSPRKSKNRLGSKLQPPCRPIISATRRSGSDVSQWVSTLRYFCFLLMYFKVLWGSLTTTLYVSCSAALRYL